MNIKDIVKNISTEQSIAIYRLIKEHKPLKNKKKLLSSIDEEDLFRLNDHEALAIKEHIRTIAERSVERVLIPLANFDFSKPYLVPDIKDIFLIPIDDKLIIGTTERGSYSRYGIYSDGHMYLIILNKLMII